MVNTGIMYLDYINDRMTFKNTIVRFCEILISALPPSLLFCYHFLTYVVGNRLLENSITALNPSKL